MFCIGDSGTGKSQIARLIQKICLKVDKLLTETLRNSGYKFEVRSFYSSTGTLAGYLQEVVKRYGRCNVGIDEQGGITRMMEIDETSVEFCRPNKNLFFFTFFREECHRGHDLFL